MRQPLKHNHSQLLGWLFVIALLSATPARAQMLSPNQWVTIYTDIGSTAFLPFSGVHYGADWELAVLGAEYRLLDLRQPEPYFGNARQTLSTVGVAGWFKLLERLQLGGAFRHEPVINLAASSINLAVQLLKGTVNRATFFLGSGLAYLRNPDFNYFVPHVFIELSSEIFRTQANHNGPWIYYLHLRLDQGFRAVDNRHPTIAVQRDFMPVYARGGFRMRRRDLQWGYDFGGQPERVFTHSFLLSYILPGKEQRSTE